ncbi:hypothetical protein GCM10022268_02080 [Sphingomonas cynarae]|uniref:TonB-dependent receptor n=1 Tax=Sphingomonas cynarae TaxID=930197 RepID=A0ABP7CUC4_9SPHN
MFVIDAVPPSSPPSAAQATTQNPGTAPAGQAIVPEIVVTAPARPKSLQNATPVEELSEARISTYGARSVNDLIQQLQRRQGGRPFSIIVNGRRLGSLADLGELPAEALQAIEIYNPAEALRFGFGANEPLLNLSLKRKFGSLSLEGEGRGTTDGGGASVSGGGRGARLNGDDRLNGFANARANEGLLARQRPGIAGGSEPVPGDQSLVPRSRLFSGTLGAARPLGAGNLDIGLRTSGTQDSRRQGGGVRQEGRNRSSGLNTTYSNIVGDVFLTVSSDVGRSTSRSRIRAGADTSSCVGCGMVQDQDSATTSAELAGLMIGKIGSLPAGDMRVNLTVRRNRAHTTTTDRLNRQVIDTNYATTSAQANVNLPLIAASTPVLGMLGQIDLTPSINYNAIDGTGHVTGTTVALNWQPVSDLSINASLVRSGSLPSNDQINAPVQRLIGLTVYDYRIGALVPVEQVTGGAALVAQTRRDFRLNADYNGTVGKSRLNAGAGYARTATDRPTIRLTEPSAFAERYFPDRFGRDAVGRLVSVDTRPFNAVRQVAESVTGTIGLSGSRAGGRTNWNVGIQGERQLRQSLRLGPAIPVIDTLSNPLSVSTGVQGRQRWSGQMGVNGPRLGANLTASRTGGVRSTSVADPATGVDVAPLVRIDGRVFLTLRPPGATAAAGGGYRLELAVDNITNARPRIRTFDRTGSRTLNPWLLDPAGRTIMISIRMPIGR